MFVWPQVGSARVRCDDRPSHWVVYRIEKAYPYHRKNKLFDSLSAWLSVRTARRTRRVQHERHRTYARAATDKQKIGTMVGCHWSRDVAHVGQCAEHFFVCFCLVLVIREFYLFVFLIEKKVAVPQLPKVVSHAATIRFLFFPYLNPCSVKKYPRE